MRRIFVFCLLFLALSNFIYAEELKDFILEADKLSYNEDGTVVEAEGNVSATHKDITIKSQKLTYKVNDGVLHAWGGFEMKMENLSLAGDILDYNLKTRTGEAENVDMYFEKAHLTGKYVELAEEEIVLKNASFTGCDQEETHYNITASSLILYPREGWLICYFGYFWGGNIPLVPVPAYIFDVSAYGVGRREIKNAPPVPEFGSNEEDGSYVNVRFAWLASRKLHGKFLISYAENNGWGTGVEGNYTYNDNNTGDFRVYSDPRNNMYGGLTHIYSFGPSLDAGRKYFFGLFNVRELLLFDLITNFSYRERINYERITVLPDVTLKLNDTPLFLERLKFGGSLTYGVISEESTIKTGRGRVTTDLNYEIPTDLGKFGLGVGYNQSWYEDFGTWTRLTQLTSYSNTWGNIDGYFGHLHYLTYDGASPFNYENYNLIPSDEIYLNLGYNFFFHRVGVNYTYYVPSMQPRDLDYITTIAFHCYDIEFTYRAIRKEFQFGFSLVTR
ncbi:LptA/OstA family protein [Candidatus Margulisiibacteriota bacterium]